MSAVIAHTYFGPWSISSSPIAWFARTSEMRMPAAPGTGRPTMYLPGFVGVPFSPIDSTLKRARRTAPAAAKTNAATRPMVESCRSDHW